LMFAIHERIFNLNEEEKKVLAPLLFCPFSQN
jgi:hypothetical protein